MKVKIKFIVNYSTGPIEMATKTITQDPTDQIRQEYLDMDRLVPSRLEFIDTNEYNNGHYDKMIDGGLARYHQDWVTRCNERNGTSFTTTDFHVNSEYRNPHHNDYHAGSSATHSLHQYGVALDVQTVDVDGDGTVEQVKPSYKKIMTDAERIAEKTRAEGLSADAIEMGLSALAAGANKTWHYTAYDNHTHADWRNDYRTPWPPSINTSGQLLSEAPELPSSVVYACSFHSGAQTLSDNHEQVTPSCNRSEHANYQCQLTFSDHALQTSCSVTNSDGDYCTATYFYLCDSHTHEYPSSLLAACGIHPASASGDHSSTYLCNESPCSNRIVPYCLALCPETDTHGKVVCTIQGCQDSTSYDPTSSSAGLHAYHSECSQYKCKGRDHSWQTSCSDTAHTNTNGDSCTATGFYECVSHTPVYPDDDDDTDSVSAGCGHVPGHWWTLYACDHFDYTCNVPLRSWYCSDCLNNYYSLDNFKFFRDKKQKRGYPSSIYSFYFKRIIKMDPLPRLDSMLSEYQHHFKYKNFNHFRTFVLGLINTPHRGTMTQIYLSTEQSTTYWPLPKFLSRSVWSVDKVTSVLTQQVQSVFNKGVYVYDETHSITDGLQQYGTHFFINTRYNKRNKNQSKFHHGHEFGAIGWLCETPQGVRLFPLAARVMCPGKKRDSSLAVLKRICAQMPAGLIVFDRGFNRRKVFTQILSQGHHLLCRTKSNAVFYYIPKQRGQGRPKRYGGRVHLPYLQYRDIIVKNKTLSVADKIVRTKMCPVDVRLVVGRTRPKKSKPYRYFCLFTSDLERPVAELIQHYRNRWQIETAFRDVKQNFGFDTYQLRNRKSLNRFAQLSFVAATLTQLIFTKTTTNTASETNIDEVPLDLEDVLLALNRHWYKAKYLTRELMTAYLQRCFQQQCFSTSYEPRQNSKKNLKIVEDST